MIWKRKNSLLLKLETAVIGEDNRGASLETRITDFNFFLTSINMVQNSKKKIIINKIIVKTKSLIQERHLPVRIFKFPLFYFSLFT